MALIRPSELTPAETVANTAAVMIDTGSAVLKSTPAQIVDAAVPLATQEQAEAGTDNATRVSPLRVAQAIDALGISAERLASGDSGDGAALVGFLQAGTGALLRSVQSRLLEFIVVTDYGADPTGAEDSTEAFQAAIDYAESEYNNTVHLPPGVYRIEGDLVIHQGVMVVGQGSGGTTSSYGTVIIHYSNGDLFTFDGNGVQAAGTGGGLQNILMLKANGFSGGTAVKIIATDDNHRPGEMVLFNLLIFGTGSGLWQRGIDIDGSACDTPGAKGVRTVTGWKVRVADVIEDLRYVTINQGIACSFYHLHIDPGGGGAAGMTIEGDAEIINLLGLTVNGELEINGNPTHVNIHGRVATLDVNATTCTGSFIGTSVTITNASPDFKIVSSEASAFQARVATTLTNVTGDGTDYTILFGTERYDRGDNYDPATGIFTATSAGLHTFFTQVTFDDLEAGHTRADLRLIRTNSADVEQERTIAIVNPSSSFITGGFFTMSTAGQFFMNEGDKVFVQVDVVGAGKVVDVVGTDAASTFSGKLLA